jgi:hypothetical protein
LLGLQDTVVPADSCLFQVRGKYWTGSKAEEYMKEGGCIHYSFTVDSKVVSEDSVKNPALGDMPGGPMSLKDYFAELVRRGHVLLKLHNHNVTRKSGTTEFEITSNGAVVLEQSLPKSSGKVKPSLSNFSCWVHAKGLIDSPRLEILQRVSLNATSKIIETGFPGVHLKDPDFNSF